MRGVVRRPVCLAMMLFLSACQAVPVAPAQDFVAAANALSRAESDYFDQIQAASDASHSLTAAALYVGHVGSFGDVAAALGSRDDFSKARAVRMAALEQLQNYAQAIAAINAGASGTWVADDAKSTAAGMTGLLKDRANLKLSAQETGIVQGAVQGLETAIVSAAAARQLQSLAGQARGPLADIATMVADDTENIETNGFAPGLADDQRQAMLNMLHSVYEDPHADAGARFAAVMAWQGWRPVLVTKGKDIADAMSKLVKANDALAAGEPYSAAAFAQAAVSAAQQAVASK